ncbi:hypothetical protein TGARI_371860 [Toxoplasma gondii ARI]|uniref:Uncharacterized protein n=1 Tax=Toxoplasma gondii ARI TaxID=1074872 RepID=A0A139XKT8_TOXGO|nr:hypothetical protein TGARI_371860 [Toxoplasma gondii ARI]
MIASPCWWHRVMQSAIFTWSSLWRSKQDTQHSNAFLWSGRVLFVKEEIMSSNFFWKDRAPSSSEGYRSDEELDPNAIAESGKRTQQGETLRNIAGRHDAAATDWKGERPKVKKTKRGEKDDEGGERKKKKRIKEREQWGKQGGGGVTRGRFILPAEGLGKKASKKQTRAATNGEKKPT